VRETIRSYESVAEVVSQYSSELKSKIGKDGAAIRIEDIPILIDNLEKDMKDLAKAMEFEKAATVRDEIQSLRALLGTSDGRLGSGKRKLKRYAGGRS
jgi:excinuclease ABC subunit B